MWEDLATELMVSDLPKARYELVTRRNVSHPQWSALYFSRTLTTHSSQPYLSSQCSVPFCVSPATHQKRSKVYPKDQCSNARRESETNINMCWPQKRSWTSSSTKRNSLPDAKAYSKEKRMPSREEVYAQDTHIRTSLMRIVYRLKCHILLFVMYTCHPSYHFVRPFLCWQYSIYLRNTWFSSPSNPILKPDIASRPNYYDSPHYIRPIHLLQHDIFRAKIL